MAVVQVMFEVPEEMYEKLASGEYSIFGGVVRDTTGKIVAHLKEIKPERVLSKVRVKPQLPNNELLEKAIKTFKNNKKNILIAGGVLLFVGGASLVAHRIKISKIKKETLKEIENSTQLNEISLLVNSYDLALKEYYKAIQLKEISFEVINNLRIEFERIKEGIANDVITFDVPEKELKTLANVIQGYGTEIRKANGLQEILKVDLTGYSTNQLIDFIIQKLIEQEEVFTISIKEKEYEKVLS